jgi:hypothetical protein
MRKLLYALLFASILAPRAFAADAKDSVYFVGPNGETAVEYLLRTNLTDKERNKWKADKKAYRYNIFTAVALSVAAQKQRQARAIEIEFYKKLKWAEGGAGGVLDVSMLAQLESARQDFGTFFGEILSKISKAQAPSYFAKSNKSFVKYVTAKQSEEKTRNAALGALIADWRDKQAKSPDTQFPVKKMFDLLNADASAKNDKTLVNAWQDDFRKDCEAYFGRKFPVPAQPQPKAADSSSKQPDAAK